MRRRTLTCPHPKCWIYQPRRHESEHYERERQVFLCPLEPKNFCGRTWTPHPRATCSAPGEPRNSGVWIRCTVEGLP